MSQLRDSKLDPVRRAERYLGEQSQGHGTLLKREGSLKVEAMVFLCQAGQLGATAKQQDTQV